jgi:CspA family cold shock protein
MEGTVKWYNMYKSYGFIEIEEGKDVFVHKNALSEGTILNEGDSVEFEIEESPKGPQAINVKKQ